MKKKSFLAFLASVLILAMILGLCGCKSEAAPVILEPSFDEAGRPIIYLWAEGSQDDEMGLEKLIESYNALPDRKATVQLQFVRSGSFDAGISSRYADAYGSGEYQGFDIIAASDSAFQKIITACGNNDNAFLEADPAKIPNLADVKMVSALPGGRHVPYCGNWVVFAFDSAKLPQPPLTWEELSAWIEKNPGRFTYCDPNFGGAGDAFVTVSLHRLMGDPEVFSDPADPKWAAQADAGFDWLKAIHPNLYSSGGRIYYPTKDLGSLDLLSSGEVWLVPVWADDVLRGLDQKTLPETVKMYQMTDHLLPGSVSSFGICSTTVNSDACCDFIQYAISPQGQQLLMRELKVIPAVDPATLDASALADLDPADLQAMDAGDNKNLYHSRWTEEIATIG